MKSKSRKSKGRRLQNFIAFEIGKLLGLEVGKDETIASRPMGQAGSDIVLKGEAFEKFPFFIECKFQEKWSVNSWALSCRNRMLREKEEGRNWKSWLLVLKRGNKNLKREEKLPELVVMEWNLFMEIYEGYLKWREKSD